MHLSFDDFVLAAATADLDDEPAARDHADALEYRMDLAVAAAAEDHEGHRSGRTSVPVAALQEYDGDLPIIATNRAAFEGGEADGADRLDTLAVVSEFDAVAAVDVELRSISHGDGQYVLDHAAENDTTVVASYHDFEATPDRAELVELLTAATDHADVGKVAVTAEDRGDVLDLLSATHEVASEGRTVATMAMGEPGRHSRAVAPLYGSRIGYAPVDPDEATAPGQYDLATLAELVERLESKPDT